MCCDAIQKTGSDMKHYQLEASWLPTNSCMYKEMLTT